MFVSRTHKAPSEHTPVGSRRTGIPSDRRGVPVFLLGLLLLLVLDMVSRFLCFTTTCSTKAYFGVSIVRFPNYDFAFSFKVPLLLMYGMYSLVLFLLLRFMVQSWQTNGWFINFAWSMVCIGAAANIFDRLYFGYVRDFIHVGNGYFNFGDVWIVSGVLLIFAHAVRQSRSYSR